MRRFATSLAVTAALSIAAGPGCARPAHNVASLAVGALAFGGAIAMDAGGDESSGCNDGPGCVVYPSLSPAVKAAAGATGFVFIAVGVVGLLRNLAHSRAPRFEPATRSTAPATPAVTAERARAALASELRFHAAAGECVRARVIADELWELDAAYYHDRVDGDVLVNACLDRR